MDEQSPIVVAIVNAAKDASKAAADAAAAVRDVSIQARATADKMATSYIEIQRANDLQGKDITNIKETLTRVEKLIDDKYVTKEQFNGHVKDEGLIKKIVLGFCGLVLVAFVGVLITGHIK